MQRGVKQSPAFFNAGLLAISQVPTNKHFPIKLRLKLFDAVMTPSVLHNLHVLPLTLAELRKLWLKRANAKANESESGVGEHLLRDNATFRYTASRRT